MVVGSVVWERAGGPALDAGEKLAVLAGAGVVVATHAAGWLAWKLGLAHPPKVDLARWAPPDSRAARDAEDAVRAMSTPEMMHHCHRTYWFSAARAEQEGLRARVDREALYVAALMHDVGFGAERPEREHCFTVACAREARRVVAAWPEARADRVAEAIVANPSPMVLPDSFGPEAYVMSLGGRVEVLAQDWMVHADNVAEILARHPRAGFASDALAHYRREVRRDPGGRFACLNPMFPFLVGRARFRAE